MGGPPLPDTSVAASAPARRSRRILRRLGTAAAAFVLVDLLAGFLAFSLISLGTLTFFALSWIRLAAEYASAGATFGTSSQLADAYGISIVAPALAAVVLFLARSALRLPGAVWRHGSSPGPHGVGLARLRLGH